MRFHLDPKDKKLNRDPEYVNMRARARRVARQMWTLTSDLLGHSQVPHAKQVEAVGPSGVLLR